MIGGDRPPATRANLLRARRRKERVGKGVELLRRKREALVRELLHLASPAVDARARLEERARRAYPALLNALASHGSEELRALGWPGREIRLHLRPLRVWGVEAAELEEPPPVLRTMEVRGTSPALTGPATSGAATEFEELVQDLLEAAPREILLRRLGEALSRTSRQVHALEQRVEPELAEQIRSIRRTLDEREREDHFRLRRFSKGGGVAAKEGPPRRGAFPADEGMGAEGPGRKE